MQKIATKTYLIFSMVVFSFAATGKLLSNFSDPRIKNHDPFFTFLSNGQLLVIAAIIEIVVVIMLARAYVRNPIKGVPIVLWLCSLFAIYRIGFQIAPARAGMCKCFGVGSILGKIEAKADGVGLILLLLLFFGGIGLILWSFLKRKDGWRSNQTTKIAALIIGLLLLNSGFVYAQDSFSPLYTAEGVVNQKILNDSGKIVLTNTFPFTVAIDTNGYWQMTWQTYFPQWSLTSTEFITYNGTDIYSVLYADKRLDKGMKPVSNLPLEDHEHPARVCRGPFPVDQSSCIGLLWIAFIGGDYVKQNSKIQPPDLLNSNPRIDPEAWSVDFQYKLLSGTGNFLITNGSFVLDKAKISPDLMGYPEVDEPTDIDHTEATLQMIDRLKAAKTEEMVRSTYSLRESKLVGNICIPVQFSAALYSPVGDLLGHFQAVKWDGQVTNIITNILSSQLLPPIKGRVDVQDRRFKQRTETSFLNSVFYKLDKTGWVLSTNDLRFKKADFYHRLEERHSPVLRRAGYLFVLIIFVSLISLPIYLTARKMWGKKQGNL